MTYSEDLRTWIKWRECPGGIPSLRPHWDAIGEVWDVGYAHVLVDGEERRDITPAEAEELLDWDLYVFDLGCNAAIATPLYQYQFDAMVACAYNIGMGAFRRSTMLRRLNEGDFDAAMKEHAEFNKAKGRVIQGLVNRRAAERLMFVEGSYET